MKYINENVSPMTTRSDFTRGLPFYGTQGDFNFTMGRSKFTPGISIKQVPLTAMSGNKDIGFSEFDTNLNKLKFFFKPGDRIRGIAMNSKIGKDNGKVVVGKLVKFKPNYSNNTIRTWIIDPKTNKITEVYVETIEKIYESTFLAMDFNTFINS